MVDRGVALKILQASPLFGAASEEARRGFLAGGTLRTLPSGSPLFLQASHDSNLYVVLEGELRIVGSSAEGETLFHRTIGVGSVTGEIAVLDGGPRTAAAIAARDCCVLVVQRQRFLEFLEANPKVAIQLLKTFAQRIRSTSCSFESSVFLSASQRVGQKLVELARACGRGPSGAWVIQNLTHQMLGQMLGLHRVSVSTQLKTFERAGVLKIERGGVRILDLDGLDDLSS